MVRNVNADTLLRIKRSTFSHNNTEQIYHEMNKQQNKH